MLIEEDLSARLSVLRLVFLIFFSYLDYSGLYPESGSVIRILMAQKSEERSLIYVIEDIVIANDFYG